MSASQVVSCAGQSVDAIRSSPCPFCYVCGLKGVPLYENLTDRLFGAPGTWNLKRCPNEACGLLWLDPMPLEKDIGKAYRTYYTHEQNSRPPNATLLRRGHLLVKDNYLSSKYHYRRGFDAPLSFIFGALMYLFPGRRASVDFSVFYLDAEPGGRLLDVGCGGGELLRGMRELGWQVAGVDFDPEAVANARSRNLTVHHGSLAEQRFEDSSLNAIVMSHLIEHVPDPISLLRECHRLLKPNGKLVIVTPNANSLGHRIYRANWRGLEPPRHLHVFGAESLKSLVESAGFKRIRVVTTVRGADDYFVSSRSLRRGDAATRAETGVSWRVRLWSRAMLGAEWGWLKFDKKGGEEVLVMARR